MIVVKTQNLTPRNPPQGLSDEHVRSTVAAIVMGNTNSSMQVTAAEPQKEVAPMGTVAPVAVAPKVSWLKRVGSAIYTGLKDVVGFLGSSQVQNAEAQVANLASLLLPAEAPIIQGFQTIVGKVFQQAVVSETALTNVANAGSQKLAAVVAAIGPELDQWVTNNFPGSATISADVKAGLVNAIVAVQNSITVPPTAPATAPATPASPVAAS